MNKGFVVLLFCGMAAAQNATPIPDSEVSQRKEIFRNNHVTTSLLELAPGQGTPMHQHDRDMVVVFITGGQTRNTIYGHGPAKANFAAGAARFFNAGYTHATRNEGAAAFRAVIVEFADPQGKTESAGPKSSRYCNQGSQTACVSEKYLFCTSRICVEDVSMGPGAVTIKHSHTTDHMLIAVSDYQLTDEAEGKGATVRTHKSGEVEYIPAGITHQLTNTGKNTARFTVILFR